MFKYFQNIINRYLCKSLIIKQCLNNQFSDIIIHLDLITYNSGQNSRSSAIASRWPTSWSSRCRDCSSTRCCCRRYTNTLSASRKGRIYRRWYVEGTIQSDIRPFQIRNLFLITTFTFWKVQCTIFLLIILGNFCGEKPFLNYFYPLVFGFSLFALSNAKRK